MGFWKVEKRVANNANGQTVYRCICECGNVREITSGSLRSCNSTSCGCRCKPTEAQLKLELINKITNIIVDNNLNPLQKIILIKILLI
jgi:hypothetical protein